MAKTTKKTANINTVADKYQYYAREIKALEAGMKPLKEELLAYAKENPQAFDESFQIKFPNGTFIALRVTDVLNADDRARELLIDNLGTNFMETKLKDKDIIEAARTNKLMQKQITQAGASIDQKETLAVYAG
ncbi:MAG: hypothetical protein JST88_09215 [Bacteroidetes bacterium]|nr:hypothetical protein [Bacteroidota bacterium]